ncbi:hypothetical protein N7540_011595 [Penicillium herquei]|nr:hypothetical protein N7540_011595 [Penicillium herquei]
MESFANFRPFSKIFKDCPLQVLVGSEKIVHYVHPGVLACSGSPVLRARVQERWMDSDANKVIDWTEFDEDTIHCVLNYLYTGTYDALRQVPATEQKKETKKEEKAQDDLPKSSIWSHFLSSSDPKPEVPNGALVERPGNPLGRSLQTPSHPKTKKAEETGAEPLDKKRSVSDEQLGNIALLHAKVYCFAHQFMFPELEELACKRLKHVLHESDKPSESFFRPLADAIRLVYDSTLAKNGTNPARALLYQYVTFNYPRLPEDILKPLVAEGGEFAVDLACKLAEKAHSYHSCMEKLDAKVKTLELRDIERTLKLSESIGIWSVLNHA